MLRYLTQISPVSPLYLPCISLQVELCFDVVSKGYEQYMHAVKTLDLQEHISPISPPYLPDICPISPLHLPRPAGGPPAPNP